MTHPTFHSTRSANTCGLRLIQGGRRDSDQALPELATDFGPSETAAEMAALYALALVRDVPFSQLDDPHHSVRIDSQTVFTLHELLCELRSMPWFDPHALPVGIAHKADTCSGVLQDEECHRRSRRWNGDGQLTLATLFRGYTKTSTRGSVQSKFLASGTLARAATHPATQICEDMPNQNSPMSAWVTWFENQLGTDFDLPLSGAVKPLATPRDVAGQVHLTHICQPIFRAALGLIAHGCPMAAGLTGPALMAAMAQSASAATKADRQARAKDSSAEQPTLIAARLSVFHNRAGAKTDGDLAQIHAELSRCAPRLLNWVDRLNRRGGTESAPGANARFTENLMLPQISLHGVPLRAADSAGLTAIAGACVTVMKAAFPDATLAREFDKLAANIALARSLTGAATHAQNHAALRLGEAVALNHLARTLTGGGDTPKLTSLDGKNLRLCSTGWHISADTPAPHLWAV